MLWVKEHLDEEKTIYSKQELCELVERYFNMFEEIISSFNNSTSAMMKAFEKNGCGFNKSFKLHNAQRIFQSDLQQLLGKTLQNNAL